jgi:hypothetical protein
VISGAPGFNWKGNISGDWDTSTANWINDSNGSPAPYQDGVGVRFLEGAVRNLINVTAPFSPNAMVVSNSTFDYTFSGGGSITASILQKQGTGKVTFQTPITFNAINLNEGSIDLQNSGSGTLAGDLTGSGNLILSGTGSTSVQGDGSGFTGNVVIQNGTVQVADATSLGDATGSITITNGGTLDVNDQNFVYKPIFVSGRGAGDQGAMNDSTASTGVKSASVNVTMLGDTFLGCSGGRWDIRATPALTGSSGLHGNGFNLTKVGSGFLSIACQNDDSFWNLNLGNIDIRQGTLTFAERLEWGDTNKTVTIADTAGLNFYNLTLTNPLAANVFMTNANFRSDGPAAGTNVFNGPITLFGATNFFDAKVPLLINGAINGSGVLSKSNVELLELNGSGSFSGMINVGAGLLGGNGSIAGSVTISSGTFAPGSVLTSRIGTFGIGGNLNATSQAIFELDRDAAQNSDRANVGGTITLGGTLTVTNVGAALQGGETFTLFNKGVSGTFNVVLPTLSAPLTWENNLSVDGTLHVAGASAPPQFGGISVSGGNVTLSGSGGTANGTYYIVASPDIAVPIESWTTVSTNQFDGSGNFSATIPQDGGQTQLFYTIRLP